MMFPRPKLRLLVLASLCCGSTGPAALADRLHLRGGDVLNGEILEERADAWRIRTVSGIFDIEKDRVVKVARGLPPWVMYERKRAACPNVVEDRVKLARWCRRHGLRQESDEQYRLVLKLDGDHAEARAALGYARGENGQWEKPPPTATRLSPEEREARRRIIEDEQLVRAAVSEWFVKVRAIHHGGMTRAKGKRDSARFARARERLLEIRDPFAIPAICSVLSAGQAAARRVMVECLSGFSVDEATMNLVVVALLDPSSEVRELASQELANRRDPRATNRLLLALRSDEEGILRHAATALGIARCREAVEHLIPLLVTEQVVPVRITRPIFLDDVLTAFGGGCRYPCSGRLVYYRPDVIGVLCGSTMVGTETWYENQVVEVPRTEVQEALIRITGQNFGFDADAWMDWWRKQPAAQR